MTAVYESGVVYKVFPNIKTLNFNLDADLLRKSAAQCIRLSKEDPIHTVERMVLRLDGVDIELTDESLEDLKSGRQPINIAPHEKLSLTVR